MRRQSNTKCQNKTLPQMNLESTQKWESIGERREECKEERMNCSGYQMHKAIRQFVQHYTHFHHRSASTYLTTTYSQIKMFFRTRKKFFVVYHKWVWFGYHPKVAMKIPTARYSTQTLHKTTFKIVTKFQPWNATAYDKDVIARKNIDNATNAGSSLAHWFFVSVNMNVNNKIEKWNKWSSLKLFFEWHTLSISRRVVSERKHNIISRYERDRIKESKWKFSSLMRFKRILKFKKYMNFLNWNETKKCVHFFGIET